MAKLKLLRNSTIAETHEQAVTILQNKLETLSDGEICIASYNDGGSVKTIFGIVRTDGYTPNYTIYDLTEIGNDVDSKITAAIDALDSTISEEDFAFITGLTQTDGTITADKKTLTSTNKTINLTKTSTTVNADVNIGTTLVRDTNSGVINVNIDGTTIVKDNTTGVLSVDSSNLVQYVGDGKTVDVSAVANNQKTISTLLKIVDITDNTVPANVQKRYALCDTDGTVITGSTNIDIYKDSSLVNVFIGHVDDKLTDEDPSTHESATTTVTSGSGSEALVYIMVLSNGNYKLTAVNIENFLTEAEFKDGLQVVNNEVSVKIDSTSEKYEQEVGGQTEQVSYLTVSPDGVKLSGLNALLSGIDNSISDIEQSIEDIEQTIEDNEHTISAALNDLESRKAEKSDLDTLSDNVLTEVEAGNGINVTAKSGKKQTVSVKLDTVTGSNDNILTVTSDGLYLSNSWDCGSY